MATVLASAAPGPAAHLRAIGTFSFDRAAPVILAALVTEDPLLLIGASGTGKTFLLNTLSEALGLEHRHYNASLISFDDLVADAVLARCQAADPEAYGQLEVGAWCDQVWLSGGFTVRPGADLDLAAIVREVAAEVGYRDAGGAPRRFRVLDGACRHPLDPRTWTHKVNDQAICVGWAGYDRLTRYHTPEHFLAHSLREALWGAIRGGALAGQGPDGKLLVLLAEEGGSWRLEQLLVTLQQSRELDFLDFTGRVAAVLAAAYAEVRRRDPRWSASWAEVALTLNPNGPLLDAGPEGDNGQTGRKLAMDFYGPRIGQGGGAISGKHLTHIDRLGSCGAREAAVRAVQAGARSCRVQVAYAPNCPEPLEVAFELEGPGRPPARAFFHHDHLRRHYRDVRIQPAWAQGTHFWDPAAPWNLLAPSRLPATPNPGA